MDFSRGNARGVIRESLAVVISRQQGRSLRQSGRASGQHRNGCQDVSGTGIHQEKLRAIIDPPAGLSRSRWTFSREHGPSR
jgi:hypothetical protein